MNKLILNLGEKSYPIYIGQHLLENTELFAEHLQNQHITIVTDETVAPLYLDRLCVATNSPQLTKVILPVGEAQKKLSTIEDICTVLLKKMMTRQDIIIALGGGVIGDLTGFTAACYQRGISFLQVPTTLLAQVDSSVGGKTGVNHPAGKNMIGAFYQPRAVVIDLNTLQTLPARQVSAGIAEIIKYGLIVDADFFIWLEENIHALKNLETETLTHAIRRSCEIKSEIVAQDERETRNRRILLNLGHTFGHAIETAMHYADWLHGEAVGCGMVLAAELSAQLGLITENNAARITHLIAASGLPVHIQAGTDIDQLISLMQRDKKNIEGKQRLVLLKDIGQAYVEDYITVPQLRSFLMAQQFQQ